MLMFPTTLELCQNLISLLVKVPTLHLSTEDTLMWYVILTTLSIYLFTLRCMCRIETVTIPGFAEVEFSSYYITTWSLWLSGMLTNETKLHHLRGTLPSIQVMYIGLLYLHANVTVLLFPAVLEIYTIDKSSNTPFANDNVLVCCAIIPTLSFYFPFRFLRF